MKDPNFLVWIVVHPSVCLIAISEIKQNHHAVSMRLLRITKRDCTYIST